MSKTVEVPFGDSATQTAQNLLAAARRLDVPTSEVRTTSKGHFVVPKKVADEAKAFSEGKGADDKPAAKKAAAKKAPARKRAPAKKAAAKKAAPAPSPAPAEDAPADSATEGKE